MIEVVSDKLFYNKYVYKLEMYTGVAHLFRGKNLQGVKELIDFYQSNIDDWDDEASEIYDDVAHIGYATKWLLKRFKPTHQELRDTIRLYNFLSLDNDTKVRVEMNNLGLYSNDKPLLESISDTLENTSLILHVPKCLPEEMKPNTVYHSFADKYGYKITIGKVYDSGLADYIEANNNNFVKAGATCIANIRNKTTGVYNSFYFYVRDEKILNIISMFGFEIKRIDKLLPK